MGLWSSWLCHTLFRFKSQNLSVTGSEDLWYKFGTCWCLGTLWGSGKTWQELEIGSGSKTFLQHFLLYETLHTRSRVAEWRRRIQSWLPVIPYVTSAEHERHNRKVRVGVAEWQLLSWLVQKRGNWMSLNPGPARVSLGLARSFFRAQSCPVLSVNVKRQTECLWQRELLLFTEGGKSM